MVAAYKLGSYVKNIPIRFHNADANRETLYPFKFRTWDYSEKNSPEFGAETSSEHVFKKPSSGFSGGIGISHRKMAG